MMAPTQFEEAMRAHLKREPFRPFAIDMDTGERWVISQPDEVVHGAGPTAVYFAPDRSIHFVGWDNVRQLSDIEPAAAV